MVASLESRFESLQQVGTDGLFSVAIGFIRLADGAEKSVLLKRLLSNRKVSPEATAAFLESSRRLVGVRHPSWVNVLEAGQDERGAFVITECITGPSVLSLQQRMAARQQAFGFPLALAVFRQVLASIAWVGGSQDDPKRHPLGSAHGSLGPSAVVVGSDGVVRVRNWGLHWLYEPPGVPQGRSPMDMTCLAPEVRAAKPFDHRADQYSCATLFLTLLGDGVPRRGALLLADSKAEGLRPILATCLQARPERRFKHIEELRARIEETIPPATQDEQRILRKVVSTLFSAEAAAGPQADVVPPDVHLRDPGPGTTPTADQLLDPTAFWAGDVDIPTTSDTPEERISAYQTQKPTVERTLREIPTFDLSNTNLIQQIKPLQAGDPSPSTSRRHPRAAQTEAGSPRIRGTSPDDVPWIAITLRILVIAALSAALGYLLFGRHAWDEWNAETSATSGQTAPTDPVQPRLPDIQPQQGSQTDPNSGKTPDSEADGPNTAPETVTTPESPRVESDTPAQIRSGCRTGAGWIYVTSNPSGATITFDGNPVIGKTPKVLSDVCADAEHELQLDLQGFQAWRDRVKVRARDVLNLDVEMKP